jgi:hypothetical protein
LKMKYSSNHSSNISSNFSSSFSLTYYDFYCGFAKPIERSSLPKISII